jgi:hypothetical protein
MERAQMILTPLVEGGLRYYWAIPLLKYGCWLRSNSTYTRRRDAYRAAQKAYSRLWPQRDM